MSNIIYPDNLKKEALKQLTGIMIIIYINIAVFGFGYFSWIISALDYRYYNGNILVDFFSISFFWGGILLLLILTIVGFYKGYRYSLATARVILVLCCFSLVGLILVLAIFWNRLKNEDVKKWLHYNK